MNTPHASVMKIQIPVEILNVYEVCFHRQIVDDREHLDELRVELGLSKQECAQIEQQVREKHPLKRFCPHCGHHLN